MSDKDARFAGIAERVAEARELTSASGLVPDEWMSAFLDGAKRYKKAGYKFDVRDVRRFIGGVRFVISDVTDGGIWGDYNVSLIKPIRNPWLVQVETNAGYGRSVTVKLGDDVPEQRDIFKAIDKALAKAGFFGQRSASAEKRVAKASTYSQVKLGQFFLYDRETYYRAFRGSQLVKIEKRIVDIPSDAKVDIV